MCASRSEIQDTESRSEVLNALAEEQRASVLPPSSFIDSVSFQEEQAESLASKNNLLITPDSLMNPSVNNEEAEKEISPDPKNKNEESVSIGVESNDLEVVDTTTHPIPNPQRIWYSQHL